MAIFEVRDEYPDDSSPVVMEDCVNNNLDDTHIDISEHDIETNLYATKTVIEKFPDGHDDDEKRNTREKIYEIHRVISEKVTEIHQDALDKVTIESPDDTIPADMGKCVNNENDDKK